MLSIQEVGSQILNKTPKPFYLFVGEEWGVKMKYLDILQETYGGRRVESPSISSVLKSMQIKHIIPLQPTLYVVRYDEDFLSELSETTSETIKNTKIIGTLVGIYESSKHVNKLNKYLSDFMVSIDKVDTKFIKKYLHSDFPKLPDRFIDVISNIAEGYGPAQLMCRSISHADVETVFRMTDDEISAMFNRNKVSTELQIKIGIASKNFEYLVHVLESYDGDLNSFMYTILSTMLELDKLINNPRTDSKIKDYVKYWTKADIYYMFVHTYDAIKLSRSSKAVDMNTQILYLLSLLPFSHIPSPEEMKS